MLHRFVIRAFLASAIVLGVASTSAAYGGVTSLTYSSQSNTLSGYSQTWADWWDPYWDEYCTNWGYNPEFEEWYCISGYGYESTPAVDAYVYTPSNQLALQGFAAGFPVAHYGYSGTPQANGTWTAIGDHWLTQSVWYYEIEWGWFPGGTNWAHLGQTGQQANVQTGCNDERDTMANEYKPGVVYPNGVSPEPACTDFEQHDSGYQYLTNFTWGELNGGFAAGNPHTGYGMIQSGLATGLQTTRTNYGMAIYLSSGYRCPHGNNSIPGASATSHHMRGRAVDLYNWGGQAAPYWSEQEFNELKAVADQTNPDESFSYTAYTDRHYHVAW